jgi:hypothetical protein
VEAEPVAADSLCGMPITNRTPAGDATFATGFTTCGIFRYEKNL